MKKCILAIDQGTTGSGAALIDERGRIVAHQSRDFRQIFPKPGWVEHRSQDIWASVTESIRAVLREANLRASSIVAIGITNQRETSLLWHRKTGKPIANAIVWQDRRTADMAEKLKARYGSLVQKQTGLVLDPYFSATKINWLLQNKKWQRQARNGELAFGTMDTFLLWQLTQGEVHATDVSNASRTLLMDIKTGEWAKNLLDLFSVPESILPEILPSSGLFGLTKGLSFLPDGIPISGIAGDQQSALFGQTCFFAGESKCTFGTGSFLLMNTGSKIVRSKSGLLSTVAWKLPGEKMTYALEGGAFICGAAVQFLRDQMQFIKHSAEIEELAKQCDDTQGVEFVPALSGLGAPHWDPNARGLICGLTRGSSRAHIARATLEAMALQNAEILIVMQKDLRQKLKSVRVDGGAAENNLLMQLQADYLGVPIRRPKQVESTALGAAFLAGLGVGLWRDVRELKKLAQAGHEFKPKIRSEDRQRRLARWSTAIRRSRSAI